MREELWPRYIELTDRLVANHMRTIRRGQAQGEVSLSIDPETSARMLIASAQMTAQQRLLGADPAMVDRMALLFIDAALGRGPGAGPEADPEVERVGPREDALQG